MRKHHGIDFRICSTAPDGAKIYGAPLTLLGFQNSAPIGDKLAYTFNVLGSADNSQLLKRFLVDLYLSGQSIEGILPAFDFVPVHAAIYDRHIDAASRMRQAQLIDDNGVWQRFEVLQFLSMQRSPDSGVIGWEHGSINDLPMGSLSQEVVPDLRTLAKPNVSPGSIRTLVLAGPAGF